MSILLRLEDCGDTLTPTQICRVLQIGRTHYYDLIRHRAFPIKPLRGIGPTRYAQTAVAAYLASSSQQAVSLRKVG